jgi:hypothetical protein
MNEIDTSLWHPGFRINRALRVMLHTRGANQKRMTLLADLEAFVHDHRPHGGMTGDATQPAWNGYRLTVACACGVVFDRWVTPEEADADLVRVALLN